MMRDTMYPRCQVVQKQILCPEKFSGNLKARRFINQMKGIADKMIVGTIHRFLQYFIVKVFNRAGT